MESGKGPEPYDFAIGPATASVAVPAAMRIGKQRMTNRKKEGMDYDQMSITTKNFGE